MKTMPEATEEAVRPEAWHKAVCPICSQVYLYLEQYKPKTCQKKESILAGRELTSNN